MKKCNRTVIEAAELFVKNNVIQTGYPSEECKFFGRKQIILVNGIQVYKKDLGHVVFLYCESIKPFEIKWAELTKDLALQVLCLV